MSDESVMLINLLKAKPGKQNALLALLKQNTDTVVRTLHGWKTTRLIAAKDGADVVIYSEWEPILKANGCAALTLDLPGAGVNAIAPSSLSGGKVILVGHSAGGMTISAVAEEVPHLLLAVVYLAGFMVPNGMPLLAMLQHETLSSALAPGLFVGDPVAIGATRINAGSTAEAYRSLLKASFYGDVSESEFAHAASQLHCDESNAGALAPSAIRRARQDRRLFHALCGSDQMAVRARRTSDSSAHELAQGADARAHLQIVEGFHNPRAASVMMADGYAV
jgi:pimeloyl-ACP methyl ester carboxylesterase